MAIRILLSVIGIWGALFLSWWVPLLVIATLCLYARAWEAVLLGLLVDFLWLPTGSLLVEVPWYTIGVIAFLWLLEPLRSEFFFS